MIKNEELKNIVGGFDITGTLINSFARGIETIMDVGRSLGTAIRRSFFGGICPL